MTTIDIYDAIEDDLSDIRHLIQQVLPDNKAHHLQRFYSDKALKGTLESDNRHLIIAIKAEQIMGVCQYGIPIMDDCDCEDLRQIQALFVHPDADFDAVAAALVYDVEESISVHADVKRLSIFVPDDDLIQIKFYAGLGFHHDQVEDSASEWYMEKDL